MRLSGHSLQPVGQLAKQGSRLLRQQSFPADDTVCQHSTNFSTENRLPEQHIFPARNVVATAVGVVHAITGPHCAGATGHAESGGIESEIVEKTATD